MHLFFTSRLSVFPLHRKADLKDETEMESETSNRFCFVSVVSDLFFLMWKDEIIRQIRKEIKKQI